MPSIAAFIQSLLSEDMYATGLIEKMDERISDLNSGQLRLLVRFCETKIPGLTNKMVLDAYKNLFRKAMIETEKRHEEEVCGERERLRKLKAAHAGVNAKAWNTAHASLDRELVKFQKFLKSKARRAAEEEVLQKEMEKLHSQLLGVPARRVEADNKRRFWWTIGATLVLIVAPILVLCLLPFGAWVAIGSYVVSSILAVLFWFIGVVRGIVVVPTLDDDAIEDETRKQARKKLKGYRAEVRRNYEEFEQVFAADMKWRDEWAKGRKKESPKANRDTGRPGSGRVAPEEEDPPDPEKLNFFEDVEKGDGRDMKTLDKVSEATEANISSEKDATSGGVFTLDTVGATRSSRTSVSNDSLGVTEKVGDNVDIRKDQTRGPWQGSTGSLLESPQESVDPPGGQVEAARRSSSPERVLEVLEDIVESPAI